MGNLLECPTRDVARRHIGSLPYPLYVHAEDGQGPVVYAQCRAFLVHDASKSVVGAIGSPPPRTSPPALAHTATL
jgi:hypothetical protein